MDFFHPQSSKKSHKPPRYLSFLSLSMGMIQPEWLFMSHFFDDPPETDSKDSSITPNSSPSQNPSIRIHFRSRKPLGCIQEKPNNPNYKKKERNNAEYLW